MSEQSHSGYQRLEDQINWYDKKSIKCKKWFIHLKYWEIIFAALIPLSASLPLPINYFHMIVGALGILVIISETIQSINQFNHNWIIYRSTCEALKHEKYLYINRSGSYRNLSNEEAKCELAERIESLISTEHAKWIKEHRKIKSSASNVK